MADLTPSDVPWSDLVRGALELESTERGVVPHRLPARARAQCSDPRLWMAESQPSGVRVAFRTDATAVALEVVAVKRVYPGFPPRPDGSYDLLVDGRLHARGTAPAGDVMTVDFATNTGEVAPGPAATVAFPPLPAGTKDVEIWLPHDEASTLVALRADAPVAPLAAVGRRRWVHHGSSISQGSNATEPTGTWPAVAALAAGVDLLNLGYSGSAVVDPFVARTIRDLPADLISLKLGINTVNHDTMRGRVYGPAVHGFLDTVRDGHPTTPIVLASPIWCGIHEHSPGPSSVDLEAFAEDRLTYVATGSPDDVALGRLSLTAVREVLAEVVAQRDDPQLTYLDGLELYGEADAADLPLPDALHPGPEAHRLIGERFAERVLRRDR